MGKSVCQRINLLKSRKKVTIKRTSKFFSFWVQQSSMTSSILLFSLKRTLHIPFTHGCKHSTCTHKRSWKKTPNNKKTHTQTYTHANNHRCIYTTWHRNIHALKRSQKNTILHVNLLNKNIKIIFYLLILLLTSGTDLFPVLQCSSSR